MTVIATDGRTMAADGLTVAGWTIPATDTVKLFNVMGSIVGCTGDSVDKIKFKKWLISREKVELSDDFAALVLHPSGVVEWYGKDCEALPCSGPEAIGCGRDFALAAMDAGLSPEQAVKIACKRSMGCGGDVMVLP